MPSPVEGEEHNSQSPLHSNKKCEKPSTALGSSRSLSLDERVFLGVLGA
jgi:hypothetical protein